jgi:hypothetical protein
MEQGIEFSFLVSWPNVYSSLVDATLIEEYYEEEILIRERCFGFALFSLKNANFKACFMLVGVWGHTAWVKI